MAGGRGLLAGLNMQLSAPSLLVDCEFAAERSRSQSNQTCNADLQVSMNRSRARI
jgi:hypothetical protein